MFLWSQNLEIYVTTFKKSKRQCEQLEKEKIFVLSD